jgi:hypothetical protein
MHTVVWTDLLEQSTMHPDDPNVRLFVRVCVRARVCLNDECLLVRVKMAADSGIIPHPFCEFCARIPTVSSPTFDQRRPQVALRGAAHWQRCANPCQL